MRNAEFCKIVSGKVFILLFGIIIPVFADGVGHHLVLYNLEVDHEANPIGIDNATPRFSWNIQSSLRNTFQTVYHIQVSKTNTFAGQSLVWDSGRQHSDRSVHIRYEGDRLKSGIRYYWRVRIWDNHGNNSGWSDPGFWEMGLLNPSDWNARWISAVPASDTSHSNPAPILRKTFTAGKEIEKARLYISGLGYFESYINGEKVGEHELDPAVTRYDRRVKYLTFDVTDMLQEGDNTVGAMLGHGWYNQHTPSAWDFNQAAWRAAPTLLAQLEIIYADGSSEIVSTDETWKVSNGPIVFNSIRNGETYDARKEQPGWQAPGFDDSGWDRPYVVEGPSGKLSAQTMPPIRVVNTLYPKTISSPKENLKVYDFGQNMAGRIKLKVSGPPGTELVIRYGERLYPDGTLNQKELSRFIWRGDTQTDRYILKGEGTENWYPRFVYHGFQYIEISGATDKVTLEAVTAQVLNTDFEEKGTFVSSNPLFNQIHENTRWSYLSNYHSYPTDCPHREKIGWSGDAHLAAEAGLYNYDAVNAYSKWIDDFVDEQRKNGQVPGIIPTSGWGYTHRNSERGYGPQWEGAFVLIPWYIYLYTGNRSIVERYYEPLKKYIDYLDRHDDSYILTFGINDHKPAFTPTEPPIIATGFFYKLSHILANMADLLNKNEDKERYRRLASNIKRAYNKRFYNPPDGTYGNGGQTSLAGSLYFGLVPEDREQQILKLLLEDIARRDNHIDAGVVGTKYVINTLINYDKPEAAFSIISQTSYPGWGHWISKGASTLWQNWDGSQSRNHIMFGSVDEWFYKGLAGVRYDSQAPGFKRIIIDPQGIKYVKWVRGSHHSPYGLIRSEWRNSRNNRFTLEVEVPPNTTAEIHLPADQVEAVKESGQKVSEIDEIAVLRKEIGGIILKTGSGTYRFEVTK